MVDDVSTDRVGQLDSLLAGANQSWLLGAGVSFNANVPLMDSLTKRVLSLAEAEGELTGQLAAAIKEDLDEDSNIEDILSQLADLAALAARSKSRSTSTGNMEISVEEIETVHERLLDLITETIRWGFRQGLDGNADRAGTRDNPIVRIDEHTAFVNVLFGRSQAGVDKRRGPIDILTTNYDTLIEDSLSLNRIPYWDGFSGGAVAYRSHSYGDTVPDTGVKARVVKLHGSIDWTLSKNEYVQRVLSELRARAE